ncbi:prephenate dehydrogenase/arogenate dehydrogenase family protein [bacterium]|nr:MAG: prephenate dehydrogenase/arogenate dehydrogenase family protein [bacterium]
MANWTSIVCFVSTELLGQLATCLESTVIDRLENLLVQLGAKPLLLDAETHDNLLAVTSHLPHVTAAALTQVFAVARSGNEAAASLVAGGWKDSTRIAAGSPEMWRDICLANREAILRSLDDLSAEIGRFRSALSECDGDELGAWFESAAQERNRIA